MTRYLLIILLAFVPVSAFAGKAKMLVVGDSLSAAHNIDIKTGWVALLRERLGESEWQVINASISGETTSGGRARLPALLEKHQPELCIIELGANDGLRGQSIKNMQSNLDKMITQCKKHGQVLLLGIWLPPNYGKQYTDAFRAAYPHLAQKHAVPLLPFFLEGVANNLQYMQADGLHPNELGQPLILENVWVKLKPLL